MGVDRRDDLSAEIDESTDGRRRQGNPRQGLVPNDLLDLEHIESEVLAADVKGAVLLGIRHG
jgi:hypothetical protein